MRKQQNGCRKLNSCMRLFVSCRCGVCWSQSRILGSVYAVVGTLLCATSRFSPLMTFLCCLCQSSFCTASTQVLQEYDLHSPVVACRRLHYSRSSLPRADTTASLLFMLTMATPHENRQRSQPTESASSFELLPVGTSLLFLPHTLGPMFDALVQLHMMPFLSLSLLETR